MLRIRGGSGLGDSLYLRAAVEHFVKSEQQVIAFSDWPEVFIDSGAKVEPFTRMKINLVAHYTMGKKNPATTQWQDVCASARIPQIPLSITWNCRNPSLVQELRGKAAGRPLVLVHGGRTPMGRTDGFGKALLPQASAFENVLAEFRDCYTVRVGKGVDAYPLPVSLDLNGSTSVSDLIDLGQACDGVIGQCSLAVPLAEVFDKPAIFVWAASGMAHGQVPYIRQITPSKVLSKPSSAFVMDNWSSQQIQEEARAFRVVQ